MGSLRPREGVAQNEPRKWAISKAVSSKKRHPRKSTDSICSFQFTFTRFCIGRFFGRICDNMASFFGPFFGFVGASVFVPLNGHILTWFYQKNELTKKSCGPLHDVSERISVDTSWGGPHDFFCELIFDKITLKYAHLMAQKRAPDKSKEWGHTVADSCKKATN